METQPSASTKPYKVSRDSSVGLNAMTLTMTLPPGPEILMLLSDLPNGTSSQSTVTSMRRWVFTFPCDALSSNHSASGVIEKSNGAWPRLKISIQRDWRLNESKEMVGVVDWLASRAFDSPSTATAIDAASGAVISLMAGMLLLGGSCHVV